MQTLDCNNYCNNLENGNLLFETSTINDYKNIF